MPERCIACIGAIELTCDRRFSNAALIAMVAASELRSAIIQGNKLQERKIGDDSTTAFNGVLGEIMASGCGLSDEQIIVRLNQEMLDKTWEREIPLIES